jgi:hypothetical protein
MSDEPQTTDQDVAHATATIIAGWAYRHVIWSFRHARAITLTAALFAILMLALTIREWMHA